MEKISSVIYTGNIIRFNPYRPGVSNQIQNCRWMRNIISPHVKTLLNVNEREVFWCGSGVSSFNVYDYLNLECNLSNYLDIYCGLYNDRLLGFIAEIYHGSLIIGFELPPFMIDLFVRLKITYIDMIIGPLRFFPDLVPSIRSNSESFSKVFNLNRVTASEKLIYSSLRRAYFSKKEAEFFPTDTLVVVGQTSFDTSQIQKNRFVDLNDFSDEIEHASNNRNTIFKVHPYATADDRKKQLKLMNQLGINSINSNVYSLLCNDNVRDFLSISSSVSIEAECFDKDGRTLIDYPFKFTPENMVEKNSFYNVYNKIGDSGFWSEVFGVDYSISHCLPIGALMDSLGQSWGSDIINERKSHFSKNNFLSLNMIKKISRLIKNNLK